MMGKGKDKVSVALCCRNGAKFLAEQLESIVTQTATPFEVVVCDDRSTDNTWDIARAFARSHAEIRWRIHRNESCLGVRANFEQAIRLATGDYIATCDQDDIWEPDKIEVLLAFARRNGAGLVYSDVTFIDEKGTPLATSARALYGLDKKMALRNYLFDNNNAIGCTYMFDAALKKYLFPFPRHYYYHDQWIAIMAYNHGGIFFCDKKLVRYRQHASNLVASLNGGGMKERLSRAYFQNKSKDFALVLRKRKEIGYSLFTLFPLLRIYMTGVTGLAYLKYRVFFRETTE